MNSMWNGKAKIILFKNWIFKSMLYKMRQYYPKPFDRSSGNDKVELDLSSYATKAHLKGAVGVDTSNLAAKSDLASLKAKVDKIDIGKSNTIPVDLSKLSSK